MIDYDELRKTVAIKHNVLLGHDDPILVTVTLNDLVIARYVDVLTARNEAHQQAISAALGEHIEQAKATGSKVITDAANYVSDQVRQAVQAALAEAAASARQEVANAQAASRNAAEGARASGTARSAAIMAAVASGLAAVVAIAALAVVLMK